MCRRRWCQPRVNIPHSVLVLSLYCKTLNVSVPFISRAKQNREFKGHEYQLQAKIGRNYYSILNCMVLIRQNKGAKIILHAKWPTFWAAKLMGFTVLVSVLTNDVMSSRCYRILLGTCHLM